jgi:serralysin
MSYYLTEGDDIITGTDESDRFVDRGPMGGVDVLDGRGGDDQFDLGPGGAGTVDGGTGFDTVVADYTNLGTMIFSNVEHLQVLGDSFKSTIAQLSVFSEISTIYSTFILSLSGSGGELDFSTRLGFQKMELFASKLTSPAQITGSKGSDTFHDLSTGYLDGSSGTDTLVLLKTLGVTSISLSSMVIKNVEKLYSDAVITASISQMQGFSSIEALTLRLVGAGGTLNLASARQGEVDASALTSGAVLTVGDGHYEGYLIGSNFNDTLSGSIRNDTIRGGLGNDMLNGSTGHDSLLGVRFDEDGIAYGEGTDILNGGDGIDSLYGGGNDLLNGGNGNDIIHLELSGSGAVDGGADTDGIVANIASLANFTFKNVENLSSSHSLSGKLAQFNAFQGISVVGTIGLTGVGGTLDLSSRVEGAVKVNASALTSAIALIGGIERDALTGTNYHDTLDGGAGIDILVGGKGNDTYYVDNVGDKAREAADQGLDQVKSFISFSLAGIHVENLFLIGTAAISGTGNSLANTIKGGGGNNVLSGGGGNDKLNGAAGADKLTGGTGADQFIFSKISESTPNPSGQDMILDFSRTQGDRINLGLVDASTTISGNQAFKFIGTAGYSDKGGELRYGISGGDTFISGDVNGDGESDFRIVLDRSLDMLATDFVL